MWTSVPEPLSEMWVSRKQRRVRGTGQTFQKTVRCGHGSQPAHVEGNVLSGTERVIVTPQALNSLMKTGKRS